MTASITRGTITAGSFDEHAEITRGLWNVEETPLEAGRFRSHAVFTATPRAVVYHERWHKPLHIRGELGANQIAFTLLEESPRPYRLWGDEFTGGRTMAYMTSSAELEFVSAADYSNTLVVFDAAFFAAVARRCGFEASELGPKGCLIADREGSSRLRQLVRHALTGDESRFPATWLDGGLDEEELVDAVLAAIAPNQGSRKPSETTSSLRARAYRTCAEYARERDFDVSIPDLWQVVGVSRRSLEYAFLENVGVSPARFLRLCRYRLAFDALASAAPGEAKVSSLAYGLGFRELGRFAVEYRKLYGEKPSETLRRPPARSPRIPAPGHASA